MTNKLSLSSEEQNVIDAILFNMQVHHSSPVTLAYLLLRWADFVDSTEDGYCFTIYDYTNDLSVRDLLEGVLLACPEPMYRKLWDQVKGLDDRLVSSTEPIPRPLLKIDGRIGWWWYRVPLKPGSELLEDLRADGFLAD